MRAGEDRVQVFLLVNQTRTNKKTAAEVYKNWVTVTMEKVDGDWLVAGMSTDLDRDPVADAGRACLTWAARAFMIIANAARPSSSVLGRVCGVRLRCGSLSLCVCPQMLFSLPGG